MDEDDIILWIIIICGVFGGIMFSTGDSSDTDDPNDVIAIVAPVEVETAPVVAPVKKTVAKVVVPKAEPKKATEGVIVELAELDTKVIDKKILDVELTETKVESNAPLFIDLK